MSFAVLQIVEPVLHALHLPEGVLTGVVAVLALGFPLTVILAWTFDLSRAGITRTPDEAVGGVGRARALAPLLAGLVAAGALVGAGVAWLALRHPRTEDEQGKPPSIAVLPFADMSPGHDQEYLADGVAEEILNTLARVEGLKVIGRTSSFSFKGKSDDLPTIGRKLVVGHILEGSVRREGARVRITAELVRASDGHHLWSQTYEQDLRSVLGIQDEVTRAVVDALGPKLTGVKGAPAGSRTQHPDAYQDYLLGRRFLSTPNPENNRRARDAFERALAVDPAYASAWAGLAIALNQIEAGTPEEIDDLRRRAMEAAERAVALAPDLPEALAARGWIRMGYQWDGASRDLDRAVALGTGDAIARRSRAVLLYCLGRLGEAEAEARRGIDLDPLATQALNTLGMVLTAAGKPAEAQRVLERALEIFPGQAYAIATLTDALLASGEPGRAIDVAQKIPWEPLRLAAAARAQHDLGHDVESRQALDALVTRFAATDAAAIAGAYAWIGDRDAAFDWLERARKQRGWLGDVKVDPVFRKLRDDPRWAPFLRRMNLEAE